MAYLWGGGQYGGYNPSFALFFKTRYIQYSLVDLNAVIHKKNAL